MKKPNILFILSDQQRWDTVSCYRQPLGAAINLTPNLDQLAAEGTCFYNAMTCQPVCGPARACLQTGKYPASIGCHVNDRMLPLTEIGIAHYFNVAGYETAYVGKWHLASHHSMSKDPTDCVDMQTRAVPIESRAGYKDFWVAADVLELTSHGYGGFMFDDAMNKRVFDGYRGDATTDFALEFLSRSRSDPFFLFISYVEPHHQNDRNCFEGPKGSKELFREFSVPGDLKETTGDWREQLPDYLGCCRNLDDNVGRLVLALKESGQYDNTIIFYTADHGCHFKTRNAEYKRSCHDASLHVPLIAKGGSFDGGHAVKELTSLIDLAPTLLACAEIVQPDYMSGVPLQQLIERPGVPIHQDIYIQISESCIGRALRTPEWTYEIEAPAGTDPTLPDCDMYEEQYLYDLSSDPFQKRNLIMSMLHNDIKTMLRKRLHDQISAYEGKQPQIRQAVSFE